MTVDDLDVLDAGFGSAETQAQLVVDADAVPSCPVALESLQAIAGRDAKVLQSACGGRISETNAIFVLGSGGERAEHRSNEDAEQVAHQARVIGHAIAQGLGKRQDPLADRDLGKDSVHEMRGRAGHAAAAAGGTAGRGPCTKTGRSGCCGRPCSKAAKSRGREFHSRGRSAAHARRSAARSGRTAAAGRGRSRDARRTLRTGAYPRHGEDGRRQRIRIPRIQNPPRANSHPTWRLRAE